MATSKAQMAIYRLTSDLPKNILKKSLEISLALSKYKKPLIHKTRFARMILRNRLNDGIFFDHQRAVTGYDNSDFSFRYSGGKKEYSIKDPESGLYLGTQSSSGIFPTITTEMAYYSDPVLYRKLSGYRPKESDRQAYFDPSLIMPLDKVVIVYSLLPGLQVWDSTDGHSELEFILKDELKSLRECMKCIEMEAPKDVIDQWLTPEISTLLKNLRPDAPMPLSYALSMPKYSISAPLGTISLKSNIAVSFPSARQNVVAVKEYIGGAKNIVIPMKSGIDSPLIPELLYNFSPIDARLIRRELLDSARKPIKIIL